MKLFRKAIRKLTKPIKNNIKGVVGELGVASKLMKFKYVINNLTFHDGVKSVQIDHVVVTKAGIHVIETKNYAGSIYGSMAGDKWTQVLGGQKNIFLSPIKQNQGHIRSLQKVLQNNNYRLFHSHVVFTDKAKISKGTPVTPIGRIRNEIMNNIDVLTDEQTLHFYERIKALKSNNTVSKREHIKSIKKRLES
jgi:hypothetical protein